MISRKDKFNTELQKLRKSRHWLVDWHIYITHLLDHKNTCTLCILCEIQDSTPQPPALTKYEQVVHVLELNFDTNLLKLTFPTDKKSHSQEELQAIESHFTDLANTIDPNPQLNL